MPKQLQNLRRKSNAAAPFRADSNAGTKVRTWKRSSPVSFPFFPSFLASLHKQDSNFQNQPFYFFVFLFRLFVVVAARFYLLLSGRMGSLTKAAFPPPLWLLQNASMISFWSWLLLSVSVTVSVSVQFRFSLDWPRSERINKPNGGLWYVLSFQFQVNQINFHFICMRVFNNLTHRHTQRHTHRHTHEHTHRHTHIIMMTKLTWSSPLATHFKCKMYMRKR